MFCDLVGSTALSKRLDPEELREVVQAYQEVCAGVVSRFDGYVAQYLGDGLLIYFGYPQAHEDDASRAVRTGLGIVEAMAQLNGRLQRENGVQLAVRLGIHTGLVVVGEMGGGIRHEQLALGETPNLAARVQEQAEPDTVLISETTQRLIRGLFACRDLGSRQIKGSPTPLALYQVLGESAARSRLDVVGRANLTPLIGREQELGMLLERWEEVKDGLGQVALLSGEAGIGKSRLLDALKDRIARESHTRWECRCSPYHQQSALYPVVDLFERAFEFQRDEPAEEKLRKIEAGLERYGLAQTAGVALWAGLLSIPLPERYPPLGLTPLQQKQKTLEAVLALLLALAARHPVLVIVEDLHWADPSTLELLGLLVDQGPTARILTVLAFRPEFHPPWAIRAHLTQITLSRLPRAQADAMIERVTASKALPAEVRQQIVAKTDGVPLFIEELTKMVVESGLVREREGHYELTRPLRSLAIPATLNDSLMARLDRLNEVKEVAQLGATLGRAFPYELLRAVAPIDEAALQQALARLVEAELLYQRGVVPEATFIFKHALIQDAAYQSLLRSRRRQSHRWIAQVLVERFVDIAGTQPEVVAHHYTEAGLAEQAVVYWQRAGQRAIRRSANLEAISHLTRGLEVLDTLPDTPVRARQELELQTTLGPVLMVIKGWGAPEVGRAYARAREVCQQVEDTPHLFSVLWGLWYFYLGCTEWQTALQLGEQLLALAQRIQDSSLLLLAHRVLGQTLSFRGEFLTAREHLDQAIALYDPGAHRSLAFVYGEDQGVICRSWAALGRWLLGYPAQALEMSAAALSLAQELAHPRSQVYALNWAAMLHIYRRDVSAARSRAEEAIKLAEEQGFAPWAAAGKVLRGWTLAEQGEVDEGIVQMGEGIASWRVHLETFHPYFLGLVAAAHVRGGRAEEGLPLVVEALAVIAHSGERYYETELHRLEGELRLRLPDPDEQGSAVCFDRALALARRQQAKSFELRAAMSMVRLRRRRGQPNEAHRALAELYSWFREGSDTADLQEARALLEQPS